MIEVSIVYNGVRYTYGKAKEGSDLNSLFDDAIRCVIELEKKGYTITRNSIKSEQ